MMSSIQPLVSVIMPTYNHADYIEEAITSVLLQSYSNHELIIVDNFSTDDTQKIVDSFHDKRIHYYKFHNHGVIASSRNYGVAKSKGEYIAFLDSDDIWKSNKLEYQVPHVLHKDVICVASNCELIGDTRGTGNYLSTVLKGRYMDFSYDDILLENPVITSSGLVRKDVFLGVGGYDEGKEFRFIEDWDFWLRVVREGKIRILNERLIKYRIYYKPDRDLRDVKERTLRVIEKHFQMGFLNASIERMAKGNLYISIGRAYLDVSDYKGVIYYLKGLFLSRGVNRIRALAGLMLFFLPKYIRPFAINKACQIKYFFAPGGSNR